jgi:hypothetical protein
MKVDHPLEIVFNAPWKITDVTLSDTVVTVFEILDPRFGARCFAMSEQSLNDLATWIMKRGTAQ